MSRSADSVLVATNSASTLMFEAEQEKSDRLAAVKGSVVEGEWPSMEIEAEAEEENTD